MTFQIFQDLPAFIQAWETALAQLQARDRRIVSEYATRQNTMTQLATVHGVSKERIRQILEHQFNAVSPGPRRCDDPIGRAVGSLEDWAERAGLELAYRFRRCGETSADRFARQLINLSALEPGQRPWLDVAWALLPAPRPRPRRPGLGRVYLEAKRGLWEATAPLTPRESRNAMTKLHPVLAQWTRLDLELHLLAVAGVAPDPETGRYRIGRDWRPGYRRDRLLIRHYMARALQAAGRCMKIGELAEAATALAQADGQPCRYSFQQARHALPSSRRFKWTSRSTYGLAEWDVGHTDPARDRHSRPSLAGEVLHRLETSAEPVHLSEMRRHLATRFTAMRGTIKASIRGLDGRSLRIDQDGYLHLIRRCATRQSTK